MLRLMTLILLATQTVEAKQCIGKYKGTVFGYSSKNSIHDVDLFIDSDPDPAPYNFVKDRLLASINDLKNKEIFIPLIQTLGLSFVVSEDLITELSPNTIIIDPMYFLDDYADEELADFLYKKLNAIFNEHHVTCNNNLRMG